jgi:hypothetical protein
VAALAKRRAKQDASGFVLIDAQESAQVLSRHIDASLATLD